MQEALQIKQLRLGERARIQGYHVCDKHYKSKLLAMGLLPGTEFVLLRIAPLGDPIELEVRGFSLSLRRDEAAALKIERIAA